MSSVVPIHLYITKDGLENGKYLSDIKKVCDEGISALWLETATGDDAAFLEKLPTQLRHIIIPVVKDPALIGKVMQSCAAGIAVKPSFTENLTVYKGRLNRSDFNIYLYVDEGDFSAAGGKEEVRPAPGAKAIGSTQEHRSTQGKKAPARTRESLLIQDEKGPLSVLREVEEAAGRLRSRGLHNTFVHIQHSDPVIHFNMSRYLKKYCGTRHVISPVPCRDKQKSVVLSSLCLGSLFYEKIGDVILLRLPEGSAYSCDNLKGSAYSSDNLKSDAYSCDNLKSAVELIKKILGSFRLFPVGYSIISCPTCGRCRMELLNMTEEIDRRLKELEKRYNEEGKRLEDTGGIIIAVMGCNVNGPGEARNADIGIAGRKDKTGIIFKNGKPFKTLPENKLVDELILHTKNLIDERLSARG